MNGSVEHVHKLLMKLWNRKEEIKILYGGPGKGETAIIGKLLENMEYIMAGHEGEKMPLEEKQLEKNSRICSSRISALDASSTRSAS